MFTITLIDNQHGYDDFDIKGHSAGIYRAKVPHNIKQGEVFGIYHGNGTKQGLFWLGDIDSSLASLTGLEFSFKISLLGSHNKTILNVLQDSIGTTIHELNNEGKLLHGSSTQEPFYIGDFTLKTPIVDAPEIYRYVVIHNHSEGSTYYTVTSKRKLGNNNHDEVIKALKLNHFEETDYIELEEIDDEACLIE